MEISNIATNLDHACIFEQSSTLSIAKRRHNQARQCMKKKSRVTLIKEVPNHSDKNRQKSLQNQQVLMPSLPKLCGEKWQTK